MSGQMTKGWCPSLFEPMAAGDGLLVRIKPRVGGITAAQLRAIGAACAKYGSGRVEVTNRANFQLRGFSAASAQNFACAMLDAGLASIDPAAERRRNILVQVSSNPAVTDCAQQLEDWLERDGALEPLPAKFGFAVGDAPASADISIVLGKNAPMVVLPGGFAIEAATPITAVQALAHAFLQRAKNTVPPFMRMRGLLAAIGVETTFAEAGLRMEIFEHISGAPSVSVGQMAENFGLGLPFGVQDAAMLHHAADLAERFGNGQIRTTSARSLVLMGTGDDASKITAAAAGLGFITNPCDQRLRIAACAGRPACPNALIDARAVAAGFAAHWTGEGVLHISACGKGCACPGAAAVTLVATNGENRYDFVLDGRARDLPHYAGISLNDAIQLMTEKSLYK
jgi:precorrin-3B synthase